MRSAEWRGRHGSAFKWLSASLRSEPALALRGVAQCPNDIRWVRGALLTDPGGFLAAAAAVAGTAQSTVAARARLCWLRPRMERSLAAAEAAEAAEAADTRSSNNSAGTGDSAAGRGGVCGLLRVASCPDPAAYLLARLARSGVVYNRVLRCVAAWNEGAARRQAGAELARVAAEVAGETARRRGVWRRDAETQARLHGTQMPECMPMEEFLSW